MNHQDDEDLPEMRSTPVAFTVLLLIGSAVFALTPEEYEELGRGSAEQGDYAAAAQHYAKAAEAYGEIGNNSAAAINHERAASFYASIGSSADYIDEAGKAAVSYFLAAEDFLSEGDYWFAANAYARSGAFYNLTGRGDSYREMMLESGQTYLLAAGDAGNATEAVQATYRAATAFYGIDRDFFAAARTQLTEAVDDLMEEALPLRDASVFDSIELYYLPLFTQVLGEPTLAAQEMEKVGDLALRMEYRPLAAIYFTSAAILRSDAGDSVLAADALTLAAEAYQAETESIEPWNYTTYLYLKPYFEESLHIWAYLGEHERAGLVEEAVVSEIERLAVELRETATANVLGNHPGWAASNYSAAAELEYILGKEDEFRRLNTLSGWMNARAGEAAEAEGELLKAAGRFREAGFLLRLVGNETYRGAYARAADLFAMLGDEQDAAGNLSSAAAWYGGAARLYGITGDAADEARYYTIYVDALEEMMARDPQSQGFLLVSIGDAQMDLGEAELAKETYAAASDELIKIMSDYLSTPEALASLLPSIPTNLVKAYRLSGRSFLARNLVEALDFPSIYSTLGTLASVSQMYSTAARIHDELASADLSAYDFQAYAVATLFSGISSLISGNLQGADLALQRFESVNHPLHSSNRKFQQLLNQSLSYVKDGDARSLEASMLMVEEIRLVAEDSEIVFLLEDLEALLDLGGDAEALLEDARADEVAGNWSGAARRFSEAGLLKYFEEDFTASLSALEDSSYFHIKAGEYAEAKASAERAFETVLDPPEFVAGLLTLSDALQESNRTRAGIAKASFKTALARNYKPEKSRELMDIARELEGVSWGFIVGQLAVGIAAALAIITVVVVLRRRSGS